MVEEGERQVDDQKPKTTLCDAGNSDVKCTVFTGRKHASHHVTQFGAPDVCITESGQINKNHCNKA